jgi:D-beta-D-heptose 7-phosphate kinase/D-beta-D-heptose 1-phosphate adenosyltransferase
MANGMSSAERKKLQAVVSRFQDRRLLVVGDLMLDQFIRGSVSRLSPEAPVPVVQVAQETFMPGGSGNVAQNLASLGAKVDLIGVVGDDAAARRLTGDFAAKGIGTDRILADPDRVTSLKCRVIADHQQVVRFDRETREKLSAKVEAALLSRLDCALASAEALILSDYGKGVVTPRIIKAAIAGARKRRIPVTVDPKIEHFSQYKGVTCITPNLQEAWSGMRRVPQPGQEAVTALGRDILRFLRSRSVLITRGAEGMSLFEKKGICHIPTQAQEVFDVTGAGDTVISVLTLALACGAGIRDAAVLANHAAGLVVGKLGTAVTTAGELRRALR